MRDPADNRTQEMPGLPPNVVTTGPKRARLDAALYVPRINTGRCGDCANAGRARYPMSCDLLGVRVVASGLCIHHRRAGA